MALINTRHRYGRIAQLFHWATAVLIFVMLPLGLFMTWLPQATSEDVAFKVLAYSLHKTIGVFVLVLAVLRIGWALVSVRPAPLHPERRLETFAAETVHWLLYAGILLAPVTGLVHHWASVGFAPIWWPFGQDMPLVAKDERLSVLFGHAHVGTIVVIAGAVAAHVAGALKHALVDRDQTLVRMVAGDAITIAAPDHPATRHGASAGVAAMVLAVIVGGVSAYGVQGIADVPAMLAERDPGGQATEDGPARWMVDHDISTLGIVIIQMGTPVGGVFDKWQADIVFDPDDLASARADVRIATGSLSVGTVSSQAVGADFLDAAAFPEARFEAGTFRRMGEGLFEAEGNLTIGGIMLPFVLPFSLAIDGDRAVMNATVTINRMDFGIGADGYGNQDAVRFAVEVNVDLTANRVAADNATDS